MVLQDHQVDTELLGADTEVVVMAVVATEAVAQVTVLQILVMVLLILATELLLVRYIKLTGIFLNYYCLSIL